MIRDLLHALSEINGVTRHSRANGATLTTTSLGFDLPPDHVEFLRWSNGVEAFDGYFRLFGVHTVESMDALSWNAPSCWKFAWEDQCLPYWCFGETAFGDQYAYALESIQNGEPMVFFLEAMAMTPEVIAASFEEFLDKVFIRNAREPDDEMIRLARQKFGKLEIFSHLVYMPPILLGGKEHVSTVEKMNARAAMICNGDIAVQLDQGPPNGSVIGVESFEDSQGRARMKLIWSG